MSKRFHPSPKQCLALTAFAETDAVTIAHNAIFSLVYGAGINKPELAAVRWRDIVPVGQRGEISVRGSRPRTVPLPPTVIKRVAAYRHAAGNPADSRLICPPDMLDTLARVLRSRARVIGLPSAVSLRGLRKAYVRHLIEEGVPIQAVSQLLGMKDHNRVLKLIRN
jgi:integrase